MWLLFLLPLVAGDSPNLEEVLHRLQENVAQFAASLPDFVCNERIVSSKVENGRTTKETVIESVFTGSQKKDQQGHLAHTENREVTTIDGKKASKSNRPKGPFIVGGGFSSLLSAAFGAKAEPYRNYRLAGTETVEGRELLVVAFSTKEGQHEMMALFEKKPFAPQDTGKVWVDPESMKILRLEMRVLNPPRPISQWVVIADYGNVTIDGKPYWMPKTVKSEVSRDKGKGQARFVAEYSNYRKFDVSVGIKY